MSMDARPAQGERRVRRELEDSLRRNEGQRLRTEGVRNCQSPRIRGRLHLNLGQEATSTANTTVSEGSDEGEDVQVRRASRRRQKYLRARRSVM